MEQGPRPTRRRNGGVPSTTPSASSSPQPRAARGGRAQRGLTCANCRARKTRCDGTQPSCKTCEVYHDQCRYEKAPPMTQIIAMARRLQEAEQTVAELKRVLEARSSSSSTTTTSAAAAAAATGAPPGPDQLSPGREPRDSSSQPSTPAGFRSASRDVLERSRRRSASREPTPEELLSDLSLDEHGKISYYGPTSAIHYPPVLGAPSPQHPVFDKPSSKSNIRTLLISNAEESRTWEEFALGSASAQINIPGGILTKLLHIHWTWVSPMFMWVYRPAFMRDMAIGGAYYSPFLLTVLCAHAARFHDARVEAMLTARVRLMLGEEIQKPSSIPTVQALLQLSAREMAFGSTSQAWLFSGMAFRMVSDLGLHHNSGHILSLGYLGPEDLEIRRRLFWSCYFWDKTMSLYLGRMPALTELPFDHTPELLDDFAENEIWSPHYQDVNLSNVPVGGYPEMRAHSVSCFENSCKIAVILNDIICQLYARRRVVDIEQASRCIRSSLDEWRDKSPPHLKYDPDNLPEACPPPHILTQNLLYYTTIILLHRPFYSAPAHHAACRRAAHSLEKLLLLLERTFGFDRVTYLMGYCIYTGASVLIHDVKTGDVDAGRKMETFLRALRHSSTTMPVLQRSLSIINNCLEMGVSTYAPGSSSNNGSSISGSSGSEPPVESSSDALATMTGNYLPAFPYLDLHVGAEAGGSAMDLSGMNLDGFSLLDSFPENHISTTTAEWYHLP